MNIEIYIPWIIGTANEFWTNDSTSIFSPTFLNYKARDISGSSRGCRWEEDEEFDCGLGYVAGRSLFSSGRSITG